MIEILDNLDVLARPVLDLSELKMGGVALGAPATSIAPQCIVEVQSSIVARVRDVYDADQDDIGREYYDADGQRLTLDEVIDHTARSDGFLYRLDEISYKLRGGTVVGFAIYGRRLAHFRHLTSYEKFLTAFGSPDQTRKNTEGGESMGYTAYYWGARKQVQWDDWDRRIILINLGDFEGNTGP
ncbi:hypothetical protein [Nonomuraea wenchangensis]|uniref:hypothetical protein n=1 Tax=Nonomuraea wenchangensis TaxID=568860 RepID=UPI0037B6BDA7